MGAASGSAVFVLLMFYRISARYDNLEIIEEALWYLIAPIINVCRD